MKRWKFITFLRQRGGMAAHSTRKNTSACAALASSCMSLVVAGDAEGQARLVAFLQGLEIGLGHRPQRPV
jgi:hypothetical protein